MAKKRDWMGKQPTKQEILEAQEAALELAAQHFAQQGLYDVPSLEWHGTINRFVRDIIGYVPAPDIPEVAAV